MPFTAAGSAQHLSVTLTKSFALGFGIFSTAMVAARALFVLGAPQILGFKGAAAGVAGDMLAGFKPMRNTHPLVKDETGTLP